MSFIFKKKKNCPRTLWNLYEISREWLQNSWKSCFLLHYVAQSFFSGILRVEIEYENSRNCISLKVKAENGARSIVHPLSEETSSLVLVVPRVAYCRFAWRYREKKRPNVVRGRRELFHFAFLDLPARDFRCSFNPLRVYRILKHCLGKRTLKEDYNVCITCEIQRSWNITLK